MNEDVIKWLEQTGFSVKELYGDYQKHVISELTHRAIIYAQKGGKKHENIRL